jgi:hypothetical protein
MPSSKQILVVILQESVGNNKEEAGALVLKQPSTSPRANAHTAFRG